ncbi:Homeodomain-like protein [Mycena metata]|uniref:Homeodomain-like protein n=1 Tax=Mycena metata TaxID=1033252 RepID=A0AAD7NDP6_9AGAR|nr:Homeodomain-like protein [Mycena metata]
MTRLNHKDLSDDTKRTIIHMYYNVGGKLQPDIARDLRISLSSVERTLRRYRQDNLGLHPAPTLRVRGRPRLLKTADVDFLVGLVQRTPDIYLREMQQELSEVCDVDASLLAIWRALRGRGYTRKRVRDLTSIILIFTIQQHL